VSDGLSYYFLKPMMIVIRRPIPTIINAVISIIEITSKLYLLEKEAAKAASLSCMGKIIPHSGLKYNGSPHFFLTFISHKSHIEPETAILCA
jgi:hypothetical protein